MSQARASHLRLVVGEPVQPSVRRPRLRFQPVVRLEDGAPFGFHAETDADFDEARFGRHQNLDASAGAWLGDVIERIGRLARDGEANQRPLSVTAPFKTLFDRDAPMAAEAGAARGHLLPHEVRIDFTDASVAALEDFALDRVEAFRRRGFRVGLDARRTWRTPMSARARTIFEAVRLDLAVCQATDVPMSRLEVAAADGLALIADHARWRDAAELAAVGVCFSLAPRADG